MPPLLPHVLCTLLPSLPRCYLPPPHPFSPSAQIDARRKAAGTPVVECYRNGIILSNRPVHLVVSRAGLHFRAFAFDPQTTRRYAGFIYEPQIRDMLARAGGKVPAWNKEKVVEMLVSRLALVDAIKAPTGEMEEREGGGTIILHPEKGAAVSTRGMRTKGLKRVLRDKFEVTRRYERSGERGRARTLGMGLVRNGYETVGPFRPLPEPGKSVEAQMSPRL